MSISRFILSSFLWLTAGTALASELNGISSIKCVNESLQETRIITPVGLCDGTEYAELSGFYTRGGYGDSGNGTVTFPLPVNLYKVSTTHKEESSEIVFENSGIFFQVDQKFTLKTQNSKEGILEKLYISIGNPYTPGGSSSGFTLYNCTFIPK